MTTTPAPHILTSTSAIRTDGTGISVRVHEGTVIVDLGSKAMDFYEDPAEVMFGALVALTSAYAATIDDSIEGVLLPLSENLIP